jgi:hypothetical protein
MQADTIETWKPLEIKVRRICAAAACADDEGNQGQPIAMDKRLDFVATNDFAMATVYPELAETR